MMAKNKDHDPRERQVLELLAYWGGGTTAQEYAAALGVRREAAQAKISAFRRDYADALRYDPATRRVRFVADSDVLRYSPSDADRLLAWLVGEQIATSWRGGTGPLPVEVVDVGALVPHPIQLGVLRGVIAGVARKRRVEVHYRSKQRSSVIHFSPHTIVWASGRHHVRGYALSAPYPDGCWIDLVLARMVALTVEDGSDYVSGDQDRAWHERKSLVFRLATDLSGMEKRALRLDYGLPEDHDELAVHAVRVALAPYVTRDMVSRRIEGRAGPVWDTGEGEQAFVTPNVVQKS